MLKTEFGGEGMEQKRKGQALMDVMVNNTEFGSRFITSFVLELT
jgi:hypothetical protein